MVFVVNIIYVVVCLVLCIAILLQSGKGGGMGAGLGGGGSASTQVFGGRGAGGFLAKATVWFAGFYMVLSLLLSYMSSMPQSELELTGGSQTSSSAEDPIIHEGTVQVNPDGSPLGSEPKKDDVKKDDAPKGDDSAAKPGIEIKDPVVVDTPPADAKKDDTTKPTDATKPEGDAKPAGDAPADGAE